MRSPRLESAVRATLSGNLLRLMPSGEPSVITCRMILGLRTAIERASTPPMLWPMMLSRRPGGPARLRALLESGQTIVAPGAFDPLAARLVEEAGFPAVYMTGFGTSAALLGRPDVGLLTMTEMADNAARIAACVDLPVTSFPGYVTGGNFPTIAIDNAGKLYALWEQAPCSVCGQGATVTA